MILVELRNRPDADPVALHPELSVLSGLGAGERRRLSEGFARLLLTGEADVAAEVRLHGQQTSLTPDLAEELGLDAATAALSMFRPEDLPPARPRPAVGEGLTRRVAALQARRADLEARRRDLLARLDEVGEPTGLERVAAALAELRRLSRPRPSPLAAVLADRWAVLRGRLAAGTAAPTEGAPEGPPEGAGPDESVAPATAAPTEGPRPHESVAPATAAPAEDPPEGLRPDGPIATGSPAPTHGRREGARPDRSVATRTPGPVEGPRLPAGSRDAAALEEAHRERVEAEELVALAPGPVAERRLFWARQAEDDLLAAVGAASYDELVRRHSQPAHEPDPAPEPEARAPELLGDARAAGPPAPDRTALQLALAATRQEAVDLLGEDPGDDRLDEALRAWVDFPDCEPARAELAVALERSGAGPVGTDLEAAADAWLAAAPDAAACRAGWQGELAAVEEQLAALDDELRPSGDDAGNGPDGEDGDEGAVLALEAELLLHARIVALGAARTAGPLPLVVDDALAAAPDPVARRLLALLARMAHDVQVVYLTEDDVRVLSWASSLAPERAGVWRLEPSGPAGRRRRRARSPGRAARKRA